MVRLVKVVETVVEEFSFQVQPFPMVNVEAIVVVPLLMKVWLVQEDMEEASNAPPLETRMVVFNVAVSVEEARVTV